MNTGTYRICASSDDALSRSITRRGENMVRLLNQKAEARAAARRARFTRIALTMLIAFVAAIVAWLVKG